jgi:lysophospholipase L1-like esterase
MGYASPAKDLSHIEQYRLGTRKMESIEDEFSYEHAYNTFGGRGDEPLLHSAFKIIALGDSFTEGAGTPVDSTWIHLLTKKINSIHIDTVTYLNAGVSGSDPFQSYELLKRLYSKYKPDLAILLINESDIGDYQNRGGLERFDKNRSLGYKWGPWWEPLYACSFIFRSIIHATTDLDYYFNTSEERNAIQSKAKDAIIQLIQHYLNPYCISKNVKLWIFSIPYEYELHYNVDMFADFSQKLDTSAINYVNLKDDIGAYLIKNDLKPADIYWKFDRHFKPTGYNMVGDLMYKQLISDSIFVKGINIR